MSPIHVLANPEVFVSQTMQKPTLSLPYQRSLFLDYTLGYQKLLHPLGVQEVTSSKNCGHFQSIDAHDSFEYLVVLRHAHILRVNRYQL